MIHWRHVPPPPGFTDITSIPCPGFCDIGKEVVSPPQYSTEEATPPPCSAGDFALLPCFGWGHCWAILPRGPWQLKGILPRGPGLLLLNLRLFRREGSVINPLEHGTFISTMCWAHALIMTFFIFFFIHPLCHVMWVSTYCIQLYFFISN